MTDVVFGVVSFKRLFQADFPNHLLSDSKVQAVTAR